MTTQVLEAYKTSKPSGAFAALDPTESLSEGIGSSYAVIGYKGKIFTLRHRGESHVFVRADDGTPIGYIDVVILRQAPVKAKSYYPDGFDENASMGKRPTCASIDGVTPDPDVVTQQSALCDLCPRNEWKTDSTTGRKGRECTDYKRLAVLLLPHQTARFYGTPLMEPVFLRIPPDSLSDLGVFGDNLTSQGWHYSSYITRISFDPTKSHPKFVFKFQQALTDAEAPTVIGLRNDMIGKRVTGEDEIARRAVQRKALGGPTQSGATQLGHQVRVDAGLAPAGPGQIAGVAIPAGAAFSVQGATPAAVQQTGLQAGAFAPPAAQPAPPPMTLAADKSQAVAMENTLTLVQGAPQRATTPPATVELAPQPGGAFGLAPPPEPDQPPAQPGAMIGQTAEDVGDAVEDPDLDAKIKAMLAT